MEQAVKSMCLFEIDRNINIFHSCWESPNESQLQECASETCFTRLSVDWNQRGDIDYVIRRGCTSDLFQPIIGCFESGNGEGFSAKACYEECTDSECNNDLESVAKQFSVGNVQQCHNCFYQEIGDTFLGLQNDPH